MQIRYYADKLSKRIAKTPEGFLICQNVPISRTGYQEYLASEILENPKNGDKIIPVYRPASEVFDLRSLASFEGKPVTNEHPDEDVTPENYQSYACGHVQNVRAGKGEDANKVLADLYITDPSLIHSILNGKREISCGYYAEEKRDKSGKLCQTNIRGNHVAVVTNGRAGSQVCIRDKKAEVKMSRFKEFYSDYGVKGMEYGGPGKAKPRGKPFKKGNPYRFTGDNDMNENEIMDEEFENEDLLEDELTASDLFEDEDPIEDEDEFIDEDEVIEDEDELDEDEDLVEDELTASDLFEDEDDLVEDEDDLVDDELTASDLFEDEDEFDEEEDEIDIDEDEADDLVEDELTASDLFEDACSVEDELTASDLFEDEDEDLVEDDLTASDLFEDACDVEDEDELEDCGGFVGDEDEILEGEDEVVDCNKKDEDVEISDKCKDGDDIIVEKGGEVIDTKRDSAIRKIVNATRSITDPGQRKKVQDAIYQALCGRSQMSDIMRITKKNIAARNDANVRNGKAISAESQQSIYDSFNPHKAK